MRRDGRKAFVTAVQAESTAQATDARASEATREWMHTTPPNLWVDSTVKYRRRCGLTASPFTPAKSQ